MVLIFSNLTLMEQDTSADDGQILPTGKARRGLCPCDSPRASHNPGRRRYHSLGLDSASVFPAAYSQGGEYQNLPPDKKREIQVMRELMNQEKVDRMYVLQQDSMDYMEMQKLLDQERESFQKELREGSGASEARGSTPAESRSSSGERGGSEAPAESRSSSEAHGSFVAKKG